MQGLLANGLREDAEFKLVSRDAGLTPEEIIAGMAVEQADALFDELEKERRRMTKNDGGPAFPTAMPGGKPTADVRLALRGMTLRDWFAGQAVAAMLMRASTIAPARNGDETVAAAQMRRKLWAKDGLQVRR